MPATWSRTFEDLGAVEFGDINLTGLGDPEKLNAVRVNAGFFRVLAVAPVAGRLLRAGEDQPGQDAKVAILSHRFWMRRFGADSSIVGRTITLNGEAHEVIGILPAGTPFLDWADVFRPLVRTTNAQRGSWELFGVGRMKPGVTLEAARTDVQRVAAVLAERHPETNRGMSANVAPLNELVAGDEHAPGALGAARCRGLPLAHRLRESDEPAPGQSGRPYSRDRDSRRAWREPPAHRRFARGRIASVVVGGGGLGLLLSVWTLDLLRASNAWGIARLDEIEINRWVLAFTTVVAVSTGILTGLMPAVQTSRGDLVPALREGERGVAGTPRQQRLRAMLVGAEVALTLALLVGAGLLLRSFTALLRVDRGFQTERRVLVEVNLPQQYSAEEGKRAQQFLLDFESRVRSLPAGHIRRLRQRTADESRQHRHGHRGCGAFRQSR